MQFQTTRESLLAGITTVMRAVNQKSPVAALSGILFEAGAGEAGQQGVSLTGSNMDLTIRRIIPAGVTVSGAVVLPARQLAEIVRRLPDVPVSITADHQKNSVELTYGRARALLNGYSAAEFPKPADPLTRVPGGRPADAGTPRLDITAPSKVFHNLFRRVIYAAGTDDLRPIFTGVLLEIDEGEIRAVATDTHRLAMHRVDYEGEPENRKMQVIVSGRALGELVRVLSQAEEEQFEVTIAENYIVFSVGPTRIISRLIVGTYPDYRQVIPKVHQTRVSGIEAPLLLQTVERAATLAQDGSPVINLHLGQGLLGVTAQSEAGSIHEEIPVELAGQELEISFNAKYLEEALRWCESTQLILDFHGPVGPAIIRPLGDGDTYLALVLPVRPF
ncbi:DNA polymerase III subunit beta [Candidatus Desulforudis audaxviator]|uniref:Beta sliding clamp n=1 Tax=Desulforudis audaxviator (strain MP104C) TaxID=477974 RepID=B1I1H5_DESAP|nr:DNA polymerase III subunit beta [Candidatus Desulforudis audaxviator]ACA58571.1 DNA polymerase III, beta subunit [Candidatus Desulforudis audaxviator MP104C]AZK58562.1 DNA polymerase III beta subunit [Candidatus Desulforudis audaxviator]